MERSTKTQEAERAEIRHLITVEDHSPAWALRRIGNHWSRTYYDGDFHLFEPPPGRPAVSLVFVQTQDGNTGAPDPGTLGGGATDKHLIYEGLSRVAADGVLAGASTVGPKVFFSVWHPDLVLLRAQLGLPRHPAQIVVSNEGRIDMNSVLFNETDAPVFVLAGPGCRARRAAEFSRRPWITMVPMEEADLAGAIDRLRIDHGIQRISAVGGRATATALIDAGLVQDLCLTTTGRSGGEPNTPFYTGQRPPRLSTIVRKREDAPTSPIHVAHLALSS